MAFGNPITVGTQVAVGTHGYIVGFNLSLRGIREMHSVQLSLNDTLSTPVKEATSIVALMQLPETESCPTLAFARAGTNVFVFVKADDYTFDSDTRISFFFWRNAIKGKLTGSFLDIKDEAYELLKAYTLRTMKADRSKRVGYELEQRITNAKKAIELV
jgi:hypothetical protein